MPRASDGTYTLPASYLAVTGETILAVQHNAALEDLATAMTGSLPRNGTAGMTAALTMGGFKITGLADGAAATDAVTKSQLDAVSAAAVTLSGNQTLTNKTIVAPTISAPILSMKASAAPTPTTEGLLEWDTASKRLVVGNGTNQTYFTSSPATTADNTVPRFNGLKGATQTSGVTISDADLVTASGGYYVGGVRVGGAPDAVMEDQKTVGTDGGTFTSGAWRTRDLNTEVWDAYSLIALSGNAFTPSANGWVEFEAPAFAVTGHQTRLYNVTDSIAVNYGIASTTKSVDAGSISVGGGPVVSGKTYRIEHQCSATVSTNGLGKAYSFGLEIYTRVKFWRMA